MIRVLLLATGLLLVSANVGNACYIYDRECWAMKRAGVSAGTDHPSLAERNRMCEDMLLAVDDLGQKVLAHVYQRDQVFSPTGRGLGGPQSDAIGYIDHGFVVEIEREVSIIINVAFRDIRYVRYDGAPVAQCAEIAADAEARLQRIMDALP